MSKGLKFHVKAKKVWSMRQRELAREAVLFAMDYYKIEYLTVKLVWMLDFMGTSGKVGTEYLVSLTPLEDDELLRTIFHEVTHTFQYIYEGLSNWDSEEGTIEWQGNTLAWDQNDEYEYDNAPWEVQAVLAESILLILFNDSRQTNLDIST